jgi:hypothetical protein
MVRLAEATSRMIATESVEVSMRLSVCSTTGSVV